MKIYQISDCHLSLEEPTVKQNLIKVLQHIEQQADGDILLLTGDLVCDASIERYTLFKDVIEAHTCIANIYAIAGNHDDLSMMKKVFYHSRIQIKQVVKLSQTLRLLFIDSSLKPLGNMPLGAGRVSKQHLSLLKKESRKHQSVVIIHHPVINIGAQWFAQMGIENHQAVIDAIHPQTQMVISGHAHQYFKQNIKNALDQIVCPATSYGFNHDNPQYERNNNIGYMTYWFDPQKAQLTSAVKILD
ncbi:metallophosphoesterase family protein [Shewanella surugensis]|uniref:Metallophosphoesterase n=1 Tax=Shewanella surugensis TaxID=212020 RepID=A0ABT0LF08_9GAMM|nr:metallophosphoesterase [Shewanella surugensis]MCL1126268.1 metallophosphoesterase [Shewanella surugensis]